MLIALLLLIIAVVILFYFTTEHLWIDGDCALKCGDDWSNCYLGCEAANCYDGCMNDKYADGTSDRYSCASLCDRDFAYQVKR